MKKLLLTSDGLTSPALGKSFLELVGKKPEEIKILFVPTASEMHDDEAYLERKHAYFQKCEEEMMALGLKKENMVWLDRNNIPVVGDIYAFDALFVCGGNTFFLLREMRRTGLDKITVDLISKGKVYVGESAGSILVGPDIKISAPFDENEVGIEDLTGLQVTRKIICPHYDKKEASLIDVFEKQNHCQVLKLEDGQGWEETDNTAELIK